MSQATDPAKATPRIWNLEAVNAPVLNLNQSGVSIQTGIPLTIGVVYELSLGSEESTVFVRGEVKRCQLARLVAQPSGSQAPVYHNGIEFQLERNPTELGLLRLIRDNASDEKRLVANRVTPNTPLSADVGRQLFSKITAFSASGFTAESQTLLDMDEEWYIMVQHGDRGCKVNCRIVHASRKEGADSYRISFEFIEVEAQDVQFLEELSSIG